MCDKNEENNEIEWIRPTNVPFPNTWSKFEGKQVDSNGKKRKYWIQDITEDLHEEIISFMGGDVLEDEPLSKYLGCPEDPEFVPELKELWKRGLRENLGIACMTMVDDKPKLVGYNALVHFHKDHPDLETHSPTWTKMLNIIEYVTKLKCPYESFKVHEYLGAMGLFVLREFRGEGIGVNLLLARDKICSAFNFKVTLTIFSSYSAQKVAEKAGFKDFTSISYEELGRISTKYLIHNISEHTKDIKYMYKSYT